MFRASGGYTPPARDDVDLSHNRLRLTVGDKIARLIGADAGEVVVTESTSINLFKVLAVALKMRPGRRVIVSESLP